MFCSTLKGNLMRLYTMLSLLRVPSYLMLCAIMGCVSLKERGVVIHTDVSVLLDLASMYLD